MSSDFLHIIIDLSLRQIVAPDGKPITICQVEANTPIFLWHEDPSEIEGLGEVYSLGRAFDTDGALHLDIQPFAIIVKRCADCICFCVAAHNDVETPIYHIKRIEQGQIVSDEAPRCFVGKVSKGQRCEFDLLIGRAFRVETIPSVDSVLGKSKIIYRQVDTQELKGDV